MAVGVYHWQQYRPDEARWERHHGYNEMLADGELPAKLIGLEAKVS